MKLSISVQKKSAARRKMRSPESGGRGKQQVNAGDEWLSLSLGRNPPKATFKDRKSQSESRDNILKQGKEVKVFSCNFCRRKFYSSQALGGHQNAHKRERGLLYYQSHSAATTAMMYPHDTTSISRSLGVQPHSYIHGPVEGGAAAESIFDEPNTRFGSSGKPSGALDEAANFMWPGSYRFDHQLQEHNSSISNMLDLDLKL